MLLFYLLCFLTYLPLQTAFQSILYKGSGATGWENGEDWKPTALLDKLNTDAKLQKLFDELRDEYWPIFHGVETNCKMESFLASLMGHCDGLPAFRQFRMNVLDKNPKGGSGGHVEIHGNPVTSFEMFLVLVSYGICEAAPGVVLPDLSVRRKHEILCHIRDVEFFNLNVYRRPEWGKVPQEYRANDAFVVKPSRLCSLKVNAASGN